MATIPIDIDPRGLAVDSTLSRIYVAGLTQPGSKPVVQVIDVNTDMVVATIPIDIDPRGLAVDSTLSRIYVAGLTQPGSKPVVQVIDVNTDMVVATIPIDIDPRGLAVDSTLSRIYVAGLTQPGSKPVVRVLDAVKEILFENNFVRCVLGADGRNLSFIDKQTGTDHCVREPTLSFFRLHWQKLGESRSSTPSTCTFEDGMLTVEFQDAHVTVVLNVSALDEYFLIEVASVAGDGVEAITLADLRLDLTEHLGTMANLAWNDEFAAGVMAVNLQANPTSGLNQGARLSATCEAKTGLVGTKIALIGCPRPELRSVIKTIVASEDMVYSEQGGAWAMDVEANGYSYLFTYAREDDAHKWITLAKKAGIRELLLSQWGTLGSYKPDSQKFPNGLRGVKAVVDKIHEEGLQAGCHILSMCIDKNDPWVSPVPDKRLGKGSSLTLAAPLTAGATSIATIESPTDRSWSTGGRDILVDNEIITYAGLSTEPPYGLTGCTRGQYGTEAATHESGTKLSKLQEVYGMYLPDFDSTLPDEMAQRIADVVNICGFDMMYFDGLEGADMVAGPSDRGARFALNVFKRLCDPVRVEASSWYHHLWPIRSQMGAWDHASRDLKSFLDMHCEEVKVGTDNLLPTQLGWWAFKTYFPPAQFATTPDVIEYLCAKCIGYEVPFSLQELSPDHPKPWDALLAIMRQYESLRLDYYFPESIKAQLRQSGSEFTLTQSPAGEWHFEPIEYSEHKVTGLDGVSNVWTATNQFEEQAPRFRIQALLSATSYDALGHIVLTDFTDVSESDHASGMSHSLTSSTAQVKVGTASGCFTATSVRSNRVESWARVVKQFSPPLKLEEHTALGVWVYGDGKGEVLNLQLIDCRGEDSMHAPAFGDHYIVVDFTGWRYFELIEPEAKRWRHYVWPYKDRTSIYRGDVEMHHVKWLCLYVNNVPPGETVTCYLSPIQAIATIPVAKLENPRLTIAGKTLFFPVTIQSGQYLEFHSLKDCTVYDSNGAEVAVKPTGEVPTVVHGENQITFACDAPSAYNARAIVTTITSGPPLTE